MNFEMLFEKAGLAQIPLFLLHKGSADFNQIYNKYQHIHGNYDAI